jgi:hypothetical protein
MDVAGFSEMLHIYQIMKHHFSEENIVQLPTYLIFLFCVIQIFSFHVGTYLTYFPHYEKIKWGLWDHLSVCFFVCVYVYLSVCLLTNFCSDAYYIILMPACQL